MQDGYQLIDSGAGEKLEKFGDRLIVRPSSVCVWKRHAAESLWDRADARYDPEGGWGFRGTPFQDWVVLTNQIRLVLRLQRNGQIGFFPEHSLYLPGLVADIARCRGGAVDSPRLLNLFAYTGMASMCALQAGAHVTHVEMQKSALEWAQINARENGATHETIKFICDDALTYLRREAQRKNTYHVVVADPPSFSRISKTKEWKLEQVIIQLVRSCFDLTPVPHGAVYLTCHHPAFDDYVLANLLRDVFGERDATIAHQPLVLLGESYPIPAGSLATARW